MCQGVVVELGGALQCHKAVFEWSEIQEWRDLLLGRRNLLVPWIVDCSEDAFVDLFIALDNLIPLIARQALHFVDVAADGFSEITEIEGQQLGVGQSQHSRTGGLSERAAIDKVRVGEMGIPIEIVVSGMINTPAVFATESEIERRDSDVIQERGVIGAGAQSGDAQVGTVASLLALG